MMNPLKDLTEGEVCDLAIKAGLTDATLYSMVSCSHPPRNRNPQRLSVAAAVMRAWSGARDYGTLWAQTAPATQHDPWQLPSGDSNAEDLMALLLWLSIPLNSRDLISGLPLPAGISPADLMCPDHAQLRSLRALLCWSQPTF